MSGREPKAPDLETIRFNRAGDVLRVTIDHPRSEMNAVDDALHADLTELFAYLKTVRDARAVLLRAEGRAFSAGGDFDWFAELAEPERLDALRADAKRMIWDLLDVELPVVAAVSGHAAGLGASLVLLSDIIVMSESATILDPHVKVGLVAGDGGVAIWPLVLGPARAKEFLLTGDPVTAADALSMGLVNRVVPADRVEPEASAFAERLAAGAPLAVRYTKIAVNKLVKNALNIAFDASTALELVTFQSADHREALAAMREKRKPKFEGR